MFFMVLKVNSWAYYVKIWHTNVNLSYETDRQEKNGNLLHRMTMRMRNRKWLWNPGKQLKVDQIFPHSDPTTTLNLHQKRKFVLLLPLLCKLTKCHLNYPHSAHLHKNGE